MDDRVPQLNEAPDIICFVLYPAEMSLLKKALHRVMPDIRSHKEMDEALMRIIKHFLEE